MYDNTYKNQKTLETIQRQASDNSHQPSSYIENNINQIDPLHFQRSQSDLDTQSQNQSFYSQISEHNHLQGLNNRRKILNNNNVQQDICYREDTIPVESPKNINKQQKKSIQEDIQQFQQSAIKEEQNEKELQLLKLQNNAIKVENLLNNDDSSVETSQIQSQSQKKSNLEDSKQELQKESISTGNNKLNSIKYSLKNQTENETDIFHAKPDLLSDNYNISQGNINFNNQKRESNDQLSININPNKSVSILKNSNKKFEDNQNSLRLQDSQNTNDHNIQNSQNNSIMKNSKYVTSQNNNNMQQSKSNLQQPKRHSKEAKPTLLFALDLNDSENSKQNSIMDNKDQKNTQGGGTPINKKSKFQAQNLTQSSDSSVNFQEEKKQVADIYFKIRVLQITNKFIKNILKNNRKSNFLKLTSNHFDIIGDQSYFSKHQMSQISFYKKICDILDKSLKCLPIFDSDSTFLMVWTLIVLIFQYVTFTIAPIKMVFELKWSNDEFSKYAFFIIPIIIFYLDIIMRLNTNFYQDGVLIKQRKQIWKQYLSFDFWMDIIPNLALLLEEQAEEQLATLNIIQMLRVIRAIRIQKSIEDHYNLMERFQTLMVLTKLFFLIIQIAHICGCLYIYIAQLEDDLQNTWFSLRDDQTLNHITVYIDGLYFAIITMITVGYGDLRPVNKREKMFGIIMTIFSCGVFAYGVNVVGNIFQEKQLKTAKVKRERYQMLVYLQNKQINKQLQVKVLRYLDFVHQKEQREDENAGVQLLNKVSEPLKNDVLREHYLQILQDDRILSSRFSREVLNGLAIKMKERLYGPGEVIFNQGQIDDRLIFFLKGEVDILFYKDLLNHNQKCMLKQSHTSVHFKDEKYFLVCSLTDRLALGVHSFFTQEKTQYKVASKSITTIAYLNFSDLIDVLNENTKEFEKYNVLKEDLIKDFVFGESCLVCKQRDHSITKCHAISRMPYKQIQIFKHNYTKDQVRNLDNNKRVDSGRLKSRNTRQAKDEVKRQLRKYRYEVVLQQQYDEDDLEDDLYLSDKEFFINIPEIELDIDDIDLILNQTQNNDNEYQIEGVTNLGSDDEDMYADDEWYEKIHLKQKKKEEQNEQEKDNNNLNQINNNPYLKSDTYLNNEKQCEQELEQLQKQLQQVIPSLQQTPSYNNNINNNNTSTNITNNILNTNYLQNQNTFDKLEDNSQKKNRKKNSSQSYNSSEKQDTFVSQDSFNTIQNQNSLLVDLQQNQQLQEFQQQSKENTQSIDLKAIHPSSVRTKANTNLAKPEPKPMVKRPSMLRQNSNLRMNNSKRGSILSIVSNNLNSSYNQPQLPLLQQQISNQQQQQSKLNAQVQQNQRQRVSSIQQINQITSALQIVHQRQSQLQLQALNQQISPCNQNKNSKKALKTFSENLNAQKFIEKNNFINLIPSNNNNNFNNNYMPTISLNSPMNNNNNYNQNEEPSQNQQILQNLNDINQQKNIWNHPQIFYDFEKMQEYKFYRPRQNTSFVLEIINKVIDMRIYEDMLKKKKRSKSIRLIGNQSFLPNTMLSQQKTFKSKQTIKLPNQDQKSMKSSHYIQ